MSDTIQRIKQLKQTATTIAGMTKRLDPAAGGTVTVQMGDPKDDNSLFVQCQIGFGLEQILHVLAQETRLSLQFHYSVARSQLRDLNDFLSKEPEA